VDALADPELQEGDQIYWGVRDELPLGSKGKAPDRWVRGTKSLWSRR